MDNDLRKSSLKEKNYCKTRRKIIKQTKNIPFMR